LVEWEFAAFPKFCLPAFLSSIHCVKKLVSLLLNSKDNELIIHHYHVASAIWDVENENERLTIPQFQKNFTILVPCSTLLKQKNVVNIKHILYSDNLNMFVLFFLQTSKNKKYILY
jgi:hypothetical protein